MEQGWDPDVRKFLLKILNTISRVLLWMLATATAGIYFELGFNQGQPIVYTIIFYAVAIITLSWLLYYLYKTWKKDNSEG